MPTAMKTGIQEKKFLELFRQNAEYYAQEVCQTFFALANESFIIESTKIGTGLFTNPEGLIFLCSFSGDVEGAFYIHIENQDIASFRTHIINQYDINHDDHDNDFISFFMEILNTASGKSIEEIKRIFDFIFIKPVTALHGKAVIQDIFSGLITIKGRLGKIHCIMSIDLATLEINDQAMEKKIEERTAHLKKERTRIAETARKAGMADVASEILHNIGNVINSVSISNQMINELVSESNINNFSKAINLIDENKENLTYFLNQDPKGKKIIPYLDLVAKSLSFQRDNLLSYSDRIKEKIKLISEIINSQRSLVAILIDLEEIPLINMIDESLFLLDEMSSGITINKDIDPNIIVHAAKIKLVHVFVALFRNSFESFTPEVSKPTIDISAKPYGDQKIICTIQDNGCGILLQNIIRIFSHGYSTKPGHNGFGLHTAANYLVEMNGTLNVESKGLGQGAMFYLTLPKGK